MTEQMVIEEMKINGRSFAKTIILLEEFMNSDDVHGELFTTLMSAREFMETLAEEIQQYRAIGTVEDIQLIFSLCKDLEKMLKKYESIGTVEELRALKEKSVAKKPRLVGNAMICPSCPKVYSSDSVTYCTNCGQLIDWE